MDEQTTQQQEAPRYAGRFTSVEELERGYRELQKHMASKERKTEPEAPSAAIDPETTPEATTGDEGHTFEPVTDPEATTDTPSEPDGAAEAVAAVGLDFAALSAEFVAHGDLTEKSYQDLQARGIGREIVKAYIEGQRSLADRQLEEIHRMAGGKEEFEQMKDWMGRNMRPEELEAYNAVLMGGGAKVRLAVEAAVARYRSEVGFEGAMISGGRAPAVEAYESLGDMAKDQADPRYATSEAFRDMVDRKLAKSPKLWRK